MLTDRHTGALCWRQDMTTVGLGADTLGAEVVEWHDLTDPAVRLGIDVVANEACHEDLTFDEDGKAVPYPDVDGTTVTVCTLEELDDPHAGQALVSSAGDAPSQGLLDMSRMRRITNAGSGQSRKPSQPQSQSQPQPPGDDLLRWSPKPQEAGFEIATDENAGALPRSKQTTEASLLAAIPDVLDGYWTTPYFRWFYHTMYGGCAAAPRAVGTIVWRRRPPIR